MNFSEQAASFQQNLIQRIKNLYLKYECPEYLRDPMLSISIYRSPLGTVKELHLETFKVTGFITYEQKNEAN
jgi:hypothetical protein